jgi:hypothetical protein
MQYHAFTAQGYGLSPATSGSAGNSLPVTSPGANPVDKAGLPWHPDSPTFWLALFAGATLLGWAGAEFGGRVGPAKGKVEVGRV